MVATIGYAFSLVMKKGYSFDELTAMHGHLERGLSMQCILHLTMHTFIVWSPAVLSKPCFSRGLIFFSHMEKLNEILPVLYKLLFQLPFSQQTYL